MREMEEVKKMDRLALFHHVQSVCKRLLMCSGGVSRCRAHSHNTPPRPMVVMA